MKTKGIAMAANVLSKKEIDEYIRLHYKPNDEADDKGFFEMDNSCSMTNITNFVIR